MVSRSRLLYEHVPNNVLTLTQLYQHPPPPPPPSPPPPSPQPHPPPPPPHHQHHLYLLRRRLIHIAYCDKLEQEQGQRTPLCGIRKNLVHCSSVYGLQSNLIGFISVKTWQILCMVITLGTVSVSLECDVIFLFIDWSEGILEPTVWIARNLRPYLCAFRVMVKLKEIIKTITNGGLFVCPKTGKGSDLRQLSAKCFEIWRMDRGLHSLPCLRLLSLFYSRSFQLPWSHATGIESNI